MSFFKNVFGNKEEKKQPNSFWNYLEEITLDDVAEQSFKKPVAIFKHSTRCSISRFVWNQFQKEYDIPNDKIELYFLDLLAHRSISDEVAQKFNVVHQSPQLIVIKDGKVVFSASHEDINANSLKQFI